MESVQGKIPLETYRKLRDYMERHGVETRSAAVRELLEKALLGDTLAQQLSFEHRETRREMERLVGLLLANLGREKPLAEATIQKAIEDIAKKTKSNME